MGGLFRSFLPLHNPIGFGAADFIELALAVLLAGMALLWRGRLEQWARRLAQRTAWCMLLLALMPVALRLALTPRHPIPSPAVADDFSYLLLADTLLHGRLANPPHALPQFFETFFVLREPTYSSIFPLGQGCVLALGRLLFGHPWAGVALSVGAFCALCYWMLRAWTTPGWALVGGVLAAIEFGPLNQWMNSYWGGAVSAAAGCLAIGALPRLRERGTTRDALLLGAGLGIQFLTRPYEAVLLAACVLLFLAPLRRHAILPVLIAGLAVLPALMLTALHNHSVTGSVTTMPYMLSRYQYGVPAAFTWQPNPAPHRTLTPEQQLDYETQSAVHGEGVDTFGAYWRRLMFRARFYRFFFLAPLYLALPFLAGAIREWRFAWLVLCLLIFSLGSNFYPYFYSHYIAAVTCLFVLAGVAGLERLSRWTARGEPVGRQAARLILLFCFAHFVFWYGVQAFAANDIAAAMTPDESWDAINTGDPEGRIAINRQLAEAPGRHLVFVRYSPRHRFQEWVYNAADIDGARIVWARDLGEAENERLRKYYPDRDVWLLEADAKPPRLSR